MRRFSQVRCPVHAEDETAHDVLLREWHAMRFWPGSTSEDPGFELANGSVYKGGLSRAGLPQGAGRMVSGECVPIPGVSGGMRPAVEYSGEFEAGVPCGAGLLQVAGSQIAGRFKRGKLVEGKCTLPCGMVYTGCPNTEGEWTSAAGSASKSQKPNSIRVSYPGGESYEGDIRDGVPHGVGKRELASSSIYRGQFQHGCRHGAGRMVLASGENLQGFFLGRASTLQGEGKIALHGGAEMAGTFADGKLHGDGYYRAPNGVEWRGHFEAGTLSGRASMSCPANTENDDHTAETVLDAASYEGDVAHDRANGHGVVTFGAVRCSGSFVNGALDGQATVLESRQRGLSQGHPHPKDALEMQSIMLFRHGARDDVFAEFARADSDGSEDD